MPRLKVCCCTLGVSSDDFVTPAGVHAFFRTLWTVALAFIVRRVLNSPLRECDTNFRAYALTSLGLFAWGVLLAIIVSCCSARGLPLQASKRRAIPSLFVVYTFTLMAEVGVCIWGIDVISRTNNCLEASHEELLDTFAEVTVVANLCLVVPYLLYVGLLLCTCTRGTVHEVESHLRGIPSVHRWRKRCGRCNCCRSVAAGAEGIILDSVARVMSAAFAPAEALQLTTTDLAVGFAMVRVEQKSAEHMRVQEMVRALLAEEQKDNEEDDEEELPTEGVTRSNSQRPPPLAIRRTTSPAPSRMGSVKYQAHTVPSAKPLQLRNPGDRRALEMAALASRASMAAYGCPLYQYGNRLCGCCLLAGRMCRNCVKEPRVCRGICRTNARVHGDPCLCHEAAIRLTTKAPVGALVRATFKNRVFETPFLILRQASERRIIIAVRGTLSFHDLITDACAEPVRVADDLRRLGLDAPDDAWVHGGFWQTAQAVARAIDNTGVLDEFNLRAAPPATPTEVKIDVDSETSPAPPSRRKGSKDLAAPLLEKGVTGRSYNTDDDTGALGTEGLGELKPDSNLDNAREVAGQGHQGEMKNEEPTKEWSLVLTGHSLGAGVATVLGLIMRPKVKNMEVWPISPPGAAVSESLGVMMESWCTSILLGKDMVPRLSLPAFRLLMLRVVASLRRARRPKHTLFRRMYCPRVCGGKKNSPEDLMRRGSIRPETPAPKTPGHVRLPPTLSAPEITQGWGAHQSFSSDAPEEEQDFFELRAIDVERELRKQLVEGFHLNPDSDDANRPMYMAGRIMHIANRATTRNLWARCWRYCATLGCCDWGADRDYHAYWCERSDFLEIEVSRLMVADHLPDKVCRYVEQVCRREGVRIPPTAD